jgi:serine/threonine protein phosphatase PrpC
MLLAIGRPPRRSDLPLVVLGGAVDFGQTRRPAMQISAFGKSDVGRVRDHNEDFLLIDAELGLFVVCDGMGGHAAGEVASKMAANAVRDFLRAHKSTLDAFNASEEACQHAAVLLREAIETASSSVYGLASSDRGKHGMGTTCISMLIRGGKGIMGHVGDSRLYLHRDGQVYQLSEDHTYLNEAVRQGVMTREQAALSPHSNVITRAVGTQASVTVDSLLIDVLPGDTYLLCTDGLTPYATDLVELGGLLAADDTATIPARLVQLANDRGGEDNVTTLIIRAAMERPALPLDSQRKLEVGANLEALRFVQLFQDMSMAELVRVHAAFRPVIREAGEVVVTQGETGDSLFVIVAGTVAVTRDGTHLADLRAGAHFGEIALLNTRPRTATATASTPTRLLELSRDQFAELVRNSPELATNFLWKLAQSLSLRLDDMYFLQAQSTSKKSTMPLGLLPSPLRKP